MKTAITSHLPVLLAPPLALLALLTNVQAASSSTDSAGSVEIIASSTESADDPMITIPIYGNDSFAYFVSMTDANNNSIPLFLDYMQPNMYVINGDAVLACTELDAIISSDPEYSDSYPSYVTYNSQVYNANNCYGLDVLTPMTTATEVNGTVTQTVVETSVVPTTAPYNISNPYGLGYAAGFFINSDFTMDTVSNISNSTDLELTNLRYLLANDTNEYFNGFGMGGPAWSGGFFDSLKTRGITHGNGHSIYYFSNSSAGNYSGLLLPGIVDQKLYTGEFYAFPQTPHEGWGDPDAILPILQIDTIELTNLDTSQSVSIYDDDPFAVVLDPSFTYSYLPREVLISLALQTDAYYNSYFDTWIVNCSSLSSVNAALNVNFGPLTVNISLASILQPSSWTNLTYSDGNPACLFNIFPSDVVGYNVLGANFMPLIYLAVDNEGGQIGVANANTNYGKSSARQYTSTRSGNSSATIGYIHSDYIPFATNVSLSDPATFTFGTFNVSASYSNPPVRTNAFVTSGLVYLSGVPQVYSGSVSASAANARSTSGGVGSYKVGSISTDRTVLYMILLVGAVMGLVLV